MSSIPSPTGALSPTEHESNIPRIGKPIRNSPASAFLSRFQQSVPDTTKYPPLRAPTSTPASQPASSISTSGTGSPRTEPTPDCSGCGSGSRSNVKANLTAASSYLSDFMTAKQKQKRRGVGKSERKEKTVIDLVVPAPRPVVAAAAVEELGKQAKAKLADEHVSEADGRKTSTAVPCSS